MSRSILASAASTNDTLAETLGGIDKLLDQLGFNLNVPKNAAWLQNAMRAGMADALVKLDGLAVALRAAPLLVTEPNKEDVEYVADQRALRVVLLVGGRSIPTKAEPIPLTGAESDMIKHLTKVWIEGFHYGRRSHKGRVMS